MVFDLQQVGNLPVGFLRQIAAHLHINALIPPDGHKVDLLGCLLYTSYDASGQLAKQTSTAGEEYNYEYDSLGRLIRSNEYNDCLLYTSRCV